MNYQCAWPTVVKGQDGQVVLRRQARVNGHFLCYTRVISGLKRRELPFCYFFYCSINFLVSFINVFYSSNVCDSILSMSCMSFLSMCGATVSEYRRHA